MHACLLPLGVRSSPDWSLDFSGGASRTSEYGGGASVGIVGTPGAFSLVSFGLTTLCSWSTGGGPGILGRGSLACFGEGGTGSGLALPVLCPVVVGCSVGVPGVAVGVPVGVPGALVGVPGSGRPRTGTAFAGSLRGVGSGQLDETELAPGEGVRGVTSLRPEREGVLRPVTADKSCSD